MMLQKFVVVLSLHRLLAILAESNIDADNENLSIDVVNSGRCAVRCLTLLQSRMSSDSGKHRYYDDDDEDDEDDDDDVIDDDDDDDDVAGGQEDRMVTLQACHANDSCSKCIRPCDSPFLSQDDCHNMCLKEAEAAEVCSESCRFLTQVNNIRPGTCPPENQATGSAAVCRKNCHSDADCSRPSFKCCSNGCGWTCQLPSHAHDGMPDILDPPLVAPIDTQADSIILRWKPNPSNSTGAVLYIIEVRSHEENSQSEWQQILRTTFPSARINDLKPGHNYRFRASAINIYGNRKPSQPSLPYVAFKEPRRPSPPVNLTEGNSVITGGKVSITIQWSPPLFTSIPINRYKIHWSKKFKSSSSHTVQDFKQNVPGNQTHFELKDLEPGTTYFVQVQAISMFRESRLKSDKAGLFITTFSFQKHHDRIPPPWTTSSSYHHLTPPTPEDLVARKPYFQNGLLKANVSWTFLEDPLNGREGKISIYWSPEGCASVDVRQDESLPPVMPATAHENAFVIYDLRFGCRYLIRVQGVSKDGVAGKMSFTFLDTPFCHNVIVIGGVLPDCPRNLPRVPDQPVNIHYKFITGVSSVTAKLSWSPPLSDVPIIGYLVVWSRVLTDVHHLLVNKTSTTARLVSKDVQTLVMGSFEEETIYAIRIQANSKSGWGRVASLRFTTPSIHAGVYGNPAYKDVSSVEMRHNNSPDNRLRQNSVRNRYITTSYSFPPPVVNLDLSRSSSSLLSSSSSSGSKRNYYNELQVSDVRPSSSSSSSSSRWSNVFYSIVSRVFCFANSRSADGTLGTPRPVQQLSATLPFFVAFLLIAISLHSSCSDFN